jgi:hypothetical protein
MIKRGRFLNSETPEEVAVTVQYGGKSKMDAVSLVSSILFNFVPIS